ncbi:hypothetical protein [Citreimonas salinaria]|uniref:Uncharacterized protein n=1 Tax=Citreimonas salinaria TaxID=321339 RepID=A0A1H3KRP2_9RHOB|nr:hypothetical protein [Citreimonas salinaria]SDY54781.1 hypothetical protein SAMN05444340_11066 [Citreimonas salinaria]
MAKNSPPTSELQGAPVFTPRAVVEALTREPVRSRVEDARVFDPASGLHPFWGVPCTTLPATVEEDRSDV